MKKKEPEEVLKRLSEISEETKQKVAPKAKQLLQELQK